MFFKKTLLSTVGVLSLAVVAISLLPGTPSAFHIPFLNIGPTHSLTGESGEDAPVMVVKIDDTTYAHPQVGVKDADIVYIEQVEGGLTRLAAVFSSKIPLLVGPVRSARVSDLELLAQYGKVGFAYSGAQSRFLPVLASANLNDLGATHYGPQFYFNDQSRSVPYAMMLKLPELLKEAQARGVRLDKSHSIGFTFGEKNFEGAPFTSVRISWPAATYSAAWSDSEKRFLLWHDGVPNVDENGVQIGGENILIQQVRISDSIYHDKVGGVTPLIDSVGEGECFLLRDGVAERCHWSRPDPLQGTEITNETGVRLTFAPGHTWVALVSKDPVFTGMKSRSTAPAGSK